MTPKERAKQVMDRWLYEVNEEAMMSTDPKYLAALKGRYEIIKVVAGLMQEHVAEAIRQAETEAIEAAAELAEKDRRKTGYARLAVSEEIAAAIRKLKKP